MDLSEIEWEVVDWVHLTQDRDQWRALLKTVMDFRGPWNVGGGGGVAVLLSINFSMMTLLHGVNWLEFYFLQMTPLESHFEVSVVYS
jgi:hypothetical protein